MARTPIVDVETGKFQHNQDIIKEAPTRYIKEVVSQEELEDEYQDYLVSLCHPKRGDNLVASIQRNSPILAEHSEDEIADNAEVGTTDQLLRMSFWDEVEKAERERRPITESKIWKGVCTKKYWDKVVRQYEWKMAYVLTPVKSRRLMTKLIHQESLSTLLKIANANPYKIKQGGRKELDPRIAKLVIDVHKIIDDRMYGQAVQRVQKEEVQEKLTPAQMEEKLKKLREEMGLDNQPVTIEMSND